MAYNNRSRRHYTQPWDVGSRPAFPDSLIPAYIYNVAAPGDEPVLPGSSSPLGSTLLPTGAPRYSGSMPGAMPFGSTTAIDEAGGFQPTQWEPNYFVEPMLDPADFYNNNNPFSSYPRLNYGGSHMNLHCCPFAAEEEEHGFNNNNNNSSGHHLGSHNHNVMYSEGGDEENQSSRYYYHSRQPSHNGPQIAVHGQSPPRSCTLCSRSFISNRDRNRHLWSRHPELAAATGTPSPQSSCTVRGCRYTGRRDNVLRHMRLRHQRREGEGEGDGEEEDNDDDDDDGLGFQGQQQNHYVSIL